jgi:hypothetical protein
MKTHTPSVLFTLALAAAAPWAAANNIALNAPVSVVSGGSSIFNPSTPLSVVTDGVFTPEATSYGSSTAHNEAIEWGGATSGSISNSGVTATGLVLEIDLGANFTIDGAMVQADDNDSYLLQYFDETNSTWQPLYNVPAVSVGYGLRTRPNGDQTTFEPVGPVVTDAVRFSAVSGDGGYAVSEIELDGAAVTSSAPDTAATAVLLLGGLGALALAKRFAVLNPAG